MFDALDSSNTESSDIHGSQNAEQLASSLSLQFEQYFLDHKHQGRDFYLALKRNDDLEGIQRKSDSLDSIGYKHFNDVLASMKNFDYLLSANDQDLRKAYYSYFEPRTSNFYLGGLLAALDYAAFREGFFDAIVHKPAEGLSPDLLKLVKIAEKLTQVQKELAQQK